jgi:hypothetical protein
MIEERSIWFHVYRRMVYGDSAPTTPLASYSATSTFAIATVPRGEPNAVTLDIGRGIAPATPDGGITVTVRATNNDVRGRDAERVQIRDTVPDGFVYQFGTALCRPLSALDAPRPATAMGTNPYWFSVGDVPHGAGVLLTYRLVPVKK